MEMYEAKRVRKSSDPATAGSARPPRKSEDEPVDLLGLLDVEEVAGAVDDLHAEPGAEERRRRLGDLDAHAAVGAAVQVQRRLRRWRRCPRPAPSSSAGSTPHAAERGAVVAEGGRQVGGVAQASFTWARSSAPS